MKPPIRVPWTKSSRCIRCSEVYLSRINIVFTNRKQIKHCQCFACYPKGQVRVGSTQQACSRGIILRLRMEFRSAGTTAYSLVLVGKLPKPTDLALKVPILAPLCIQLPMTRAISPLPDSIAIVRLISLGLREQYQDKGLYTAAYRVISVT